MALPLGIETFTATFGPYQDLITGDPVGGVTVTFTPVLPQVNGKTPQIVHLPTGRVLLSRATSIVTDDSGAQGTVVLPCCDATGLNISNFSYLMRVSFPRPASGDSYPSIPDRVIQVLKANADQVIDLDELADIVTVNGTVVSVPTVQSVAGLTGVVTAAQLAAAGVGGGGGSASAATSTAQGIVELATVTEVGTGTDTARAVTPAGVAAVLADEVARVGSTYAPIASPAFTGTVTGVSKAAVGLGNVDNTSDVSKPVSTAQAAADALRLALPSGTPTSGQVPIATGTGTATAWGTPAGSGGTATGTTFTPAGTIAATNVQAAIAELDSEAIARARTAILPDGGNSIWTRTTDPAGLAVNGDVWLAP